MTEQEFDTFISNSPNVLVAPAGYGKTHTIASSVESLRAKGVNRILVLTHTNAGITSIREKFKKESVPQNGVTICTIAGFLQRIVHSLSKERMPDGNDSDAFYAKLYECALNLFQHSTILKTILEYSYEHIFVDEFQDCNRAQYEIVKVLCKWKVCVHMLLDPLQTIFDFETNHPNYLDFESNCQSRAPEKLFRLDVPYRWRNANSPLERFVPVWRKTIQDALTQGLKSIDLSQLPGITYISDTPDNVRIKINYYVNNSTSILVLHSLYHANNIKARGLICANTGYRLRLIESIDHPDFYNVAAKIDDELKNDTLVESIVYDIMMAVGTSKTSLEGWIKPNRLVVKHTDIALSTKLNDAVKLPSKKQAIVEALSILTRDIKLNVQRIELLADIKSAVLSSETSGKTVRQEIERRRDLARVQGRRLHGKVIGTTLLTKGLEADTVLVIKPSELFRNDNGLKHLYVALTRAVNRVILIDTQ